MRVLRITLEGVTTSFRYPMFMLGVQPTFEMPPPATIYGHVCSALGMWVDPVGVRFAYHFTHARKLADLEHVHVLSASSGKLPDTREPKVLEGNVNPFQREILFEPKLTLYLNQPDWASAFRSPHYPVALGRSQDLCVYTDVRVVDLVKEPTAYFEHTLWPYDFHIKPPQGVVLQMPRYVNYADNRRAFFGQYVMVQHRVMSDDPRMLVFDGAPETFLVDPDSPVVSGRRLGLVFHGFVEG
jgi:CRISPR-associated protein Cas5t